MKSIKDIDETGIIVSVIKDLERWNAWVIVVPINKQSE